MIMVCNVPDEVVKNVRMGTWCGSSVVEKMVANGTPIPDNATNGDMIKAMFPNASFYYHKASDIVDDYVSVCIDDCDTQQYYSTRAWWSAPYQKGGK